MARAMVQALVYALGHGHPRLGRLGRAPSLMSGLSVYLSIRLPVYRSIGLCQVRARAGQGCNREALISSLAHDPRL